MGNDGRLTLQPIATIENDFPTKFGVPRQSGIVDELRSRIVFLPEYRQAEAFRGLKDFSHLWLIWGFSEVKRKGWSATVRAAPIGRESAHGRFRYALPFPSQSYRPFLRPAVGNLRGRPFWNLPDRFGGRSDERHAHL